MLVLLPMLYCFLQKCFSLPVSAVICSYFFFVFSAPCALILSACACGCFAQFLFIHVLFAFSFLLTFSTC
nr:MAG TPA: hypothetical protein [Caudoviricetes sp.]